MKYLKRNGPRGRFLYFADGKMISKKSIPKDIVDLLVVGESFDAERLEEPEPTVKKCLFCGNYATDTRFVNMTVVNLCEQDYFEKTVGDIAAKLY